MNIFEQHGIRSLMSDKENGFNKEEMKSINNNGMLL